MLDLLEKSNKLKSKWNRLNVEYTAFLTKRETTKKYTRQVRQYINEQQMKRERVKYKQKQLTQQRKKRHTRIKKVRYYEQNRIHQSFHRASGDSETAGDHVRLSG